MTNEDSTLADAEREAATALVDSWVALWNGDDDIAGSIISETNRVHAAMFDGGDGSAVVGVSGMQAFVADLRSLMSDLVFSVEVGPIVDGDQLAVRW